MASCIVGGDTSVTGAKSCEILALSREYHPARRACSCRGVKRVVQFSIFDRSLGLLGRGGGRLRTCVLGLKRKLCVPPYVVDRAYLPRMMKKRGTLGLILPSSLRLAPDAGRTVFEWEQSLEEVNLYIETPPGVTADRLDCKITPRHICLGVKGNPPFIDVRVVFRIFTHIPGLTERGAGPKRQTEVVSVPCATHVDVSSA